PLRERRRGRDSEPSKDETQAHRLSAPHLLRLHHLQLRRTAVPYLGGRRGPGHVRYGLAAPGARYQGCVREHGPIAGGAYEGGALGKRAADFRAVETVKAASVDSRTDQGYICLNR